MSFRTYHDVVGADRSDLGAQVRAQRARVSRRLASVKRVVAVMSGKGGVGKSYVTSLIALEASHLHNLTVGVVDADLRSPTVARLLQAKGPLQVREDGVVPARGEADVRVVSTDLLLDESQPLRWHEPRGDEFIWRGALEANTLREFLSDVVWEALDLLLVDLPPGADGVSDLKALVPDLHGAIAVTIPSDESRRSVSRTMTSARESGVSLLGVVENMSGYWCRDCGETRPLFPGNAGYALADAFDIPLLGHLRFVPPGDTNAASSNEVTARCLDAIL